MLAYEPWFVSKIYKLVDSFFAGAIKPGAQTTGTGPAKPIFRSRLGSG